MREDDLMKRVAQGDQVAFTTLFDMHSGHLLGYATRLLKDHAKAEDVVQETWLKIVQLASTYKGSGHFVAWAYTLVRNRSLNEIRTTSRLDLKENPEDYAQKSDEDFSLQVETREQFKNVIEQIEKLPNTQRIAVLLWAVEDLSYEDIGRELNLSISAVKSLLFRARDHLRGSK